MGKVSGNVLAGDGQTPVPSADVYIRSDNPYFARTYKANTYNNISYSFVTDLTQGSSGIGIPLDSFTVWATKSIGYSITMESPHVSGEFLEGQDATQVDVVFSNTGIVEGSVKKATGEPVGGATVTADNYSDIDAETAQDGSYRMILVPPGEHTLKVSVNHPQGSDIEAYATATAVEGETTTVDLALPPLGSVTGILHGRDGQPIINSWIYLEQGSYSWSDTTDTNGAFSINDVPSGDAKLEYYDTSYSEYIYVPVNIVADQTIKTDLDLREYLPPPVELFDGGGYRWDIQGSGTIASGTDGAFYTGYSGGGLILSLNNSSYHTFRLYHKEYQERGVQLGPYTSGSLVVSRKIYVPDDDSFVRYLEIIENNGDTDVNAKVTIKSYLGDSYSNETHLIETASGDAEFTTDDRYIISDDADGTGIPAVVHVFGGDGAQENISEASYQDYGYYNYDELSYTFDLTVPAGGRKIIMHFASQNATRADAQSSAQHLSCLQGSALNGLTDDEKADIVNFVPVTDSDCDGLNDEQEVIYGSDPNNPDTDGDTILDGIEVKNGLDPTDASDGTADADGDGLNNAAEIVAGTDMTNPDTDGDGLTDGFEVINGFNPLAAGDEVLDPDNDGLTNLEEQSNGLDPLDPDSDDDGTIDGLEVKDEVVLKVTGHSERYMGDVVSTSDSQGNIHLVWTDRRSGNSDIYYKLLSPGGKTLIDDTQITIDLDVQYHPSVALDSSGRAHIVWTDERGSWANIYYTIIDPSLDDRDGSAASDEAIRIVDDTIISTEGRWSIEPKIAIDGLDRVHVIWGDDDDGGVHYISLNNDGSVRIAERTFATGYYSGEHNLAVDSTNNVHIVWQSYTDNDLSKEVYYRMLDGDTGETLIDNTVITTEDDYDSEAPAVFVNKLNHVFVAYTDEKLSVTGGSVEEVFVLGLDPYLSALDGSIVDPASITIAPEALVTEDDGVRSSWADINGLADGRIVLTYYNYDQREYEYNELHFRALDSDLSTVSDSIIAQNASYYSYYYTPTLQRALSARGITSYVTWTEEDENRNKTIWLRIINADNDGDLLSNQDERSIGTDPDNPDSDNDGLLDGFEVDYGLNPLQSGDQAEDPDGDLLDNLGEQGAGTDPHKADTDNDGLTDKEEVDLGTNPLISDTDGDSLADGSEVNTYGTDPLKKDTDGDSLDDNVEIAHGLNPTDGTDAAADNDGDGLTNSQEISAGTELNNSDTDSDGLLDGLEINTYGTDPLVADTDGDGLIDGDEISYGADPNRADTDNDGLTDGDEVHTWGSNPTLIDSDGDGLIDGFEAANGFDPTVAGEQIGDPDSDGLDNISEQAAGTDPNLADTDSDGLNDGDEVNIWNTDPLGSDTDGDGLTDGFETRYNLDPLTTGDETQDPDSDDLNNLAEQTAGTNPQNPDTDGDGLRDGFEIQYGFDPLLTGDETEDPDSDGLTNLEEQTLGTDPTNADSDWDMLNDGDEVHIYHTDPVMRDTDMDQLGDGDEVNGTNGYITDPNNPDTDGGGRTDGQEVMTDGTDPTNPADDQVPIALTEGEGASDHSAVAIDSTGNIHVVFQDDRTGNSQIYYTMLSPDKSTLIDVTRITGTATAAGRPALVVDNLDVVHVVWQDAGTSSDEIYHMAVDPSLDDRDGSAADSGEITVVAPHLVSANDGVASTDPRVASDTQGRLHIVWGDTDTGQVHYTRLAGDGTIHIADQIIFDAGSALTWGRALPTVAVDGNGNVHIAWMDRPSTSVEIFYAMLDGQSSDGSAAGVLINTTALTPSDGHDTRYPSIGIGPGNEVTLVYDSVTMIPFWGSYVAGCEVAMLRIDPARDDQNGNPASVGSITALAETPIVSRTFTTTLPPSAAVDANGNVYVCYYDSYSETSTPPVGQLSFTIMDSTGTAVSATKQITDSSTATTTEQLTLPSVAFNPNGDLPGTAFVAWSDNRGTKPVIMLRIIKNATDE